MTLSHTGADSHEIRALTGIRGFAAILVMVFHFYGVWVLLLPSLSLAERPIGRGGIGVDLFFILSGFILTYVYNADSKQLTLQEYGQFLWFRLARIYPNHFATLVLMVIMVTSAPIFGVTLTGFYPLDDLPYQLTLTHSWPFAPEAAVSVWNFPAWSISAEWFAYLAVFPFVALLLRRIQSSALALFLGFGALAGWCVVMKTYSLSSNNSSLMQVSCEFFAGSMFFRVFALGSVVVRFCQSCLTGLFVAFIVLLSFASSLGISICILSVCPMLLLGLTSEVSLVARLFSTPAALWLGRVSYSLYMSHGIALKLIKVLMPSTRYVHSSLACRTFIFFASLSIIFAMTAGLYYVVEIPARNYLRKVRPPWGKRCQGDGQDALK